MMNTIFYFTGTGNSLKVAKDIAAEIENTNLISMGNSIDKIPSLDSQNVIGIIFPIYYFGLPIIVRDFLRNLHIPDNCYVYIIVTRGHSPAGGARKQLNQIFEAKDKQYHFFQYITMGDNYPFHGFNPSDENVKEKRNKKASLKIKKIIDAINKKKKSKRFSPLDYPPFPFITFYVPRYGYNHFKRVYNDDTHFAVDTICCNKCKKCVKFCPVNNICFDTDIKWKHENCQLCLACYNCCPNNAIQYVDPINKVNTNGKNQYWNH